MYAYVLTGMTGKRAADGRTSSVAGIDINTRVMTVSLLALLPAILLVAIAWTLVGSLSLFLAPLVIGGAVYLFVSRTKDSMEVTQFRARSDRATGKREVGHFFVSGRQVDPHMSEHGVVRVNTVPVGASETSGETLWH